MAWVVAFFISSELKLNIFNMYFSLNYFAGRSVALVSEVLSWSVYKINSKASSFPGPFPFMFVQTQRGRFMRTRFILLQKFR